MTAAVTSALDRLAVARGVARQYRDGFGETRTVSPDTLVAVLGALGEDMESAADAEDCLRRLEPAPSGSRESSRSSGSSGPPVPRMPPVLVAWDGRLAVDLSDPADRAEVELEGGAKVLPLEVRDTGDGPVATPSRALPFGVHRLRFLAAGAAAPVSAIVISAPRRTRPLADGAWGLFAPTYALRDGRPTLTGDLTCLEGLCKVAGGFGASYVATLPLLANYSTYDTAGAVSSPYSPISRMWWDEAYLDPARVPELVGLPELAGLAGLGGLAGLVGSGLAEGGSSRVHLAVQADVAAAAGHLRPLLDAGVERLQAGGGHRLDAFKRFQEERPEVELYGLFRAAAEVAGTKRREWPNTFAPGRMAAGRDVPATAVAAHIYAQFVTDEQVGAVAAAAARSGCGLMLDLPVGCRSDGFDPWAYPGSFASAPAAVGAPPDRFFKGGQNWGFLPLDPEGDRRAGYPVVRSALRHLMNHSDALRIDHVMGLQRLWWIPPGAEATEGAYVYYAFDEMLALTCLEAWRCRVSVVGEDLGTVDPDVRMRLSEHGIAGMHVAVFDLVSRPGAPLEPRPGSVAFVDTHDTATFAGWFDETDIDDRSALGWLDAAAADAERAMRRKARLSCVKRLVADGLLEHESTDDPTAVHAAVLEELGRSRAGLVSVNIEDLVGEHDPQNIPGTTDQHVNFRRRLTRSITALAADRLTFGTLQRLDHARRTATGLRETQP